MTAFTARAQQQVLALQELFERDERLDALRQLHRCINEAAAQIEHDPRSGVAAPRPYPSLAQPGQLWRKVHRYWFRCAATAPPIITAVFFETANIPDRL